MPVVQGGRGGEGGGGGGGGGKGTHLHSAWGKWTITVEHPWSVVVV